MRVGKKTTLIMETVFEQGLAVNLVPTPTKEYRQYRKLKRAIEAFAVRDNTPDIASAGTTTLTGPRVLIYEQDPSVSDPESPTDAILIKKKWLPGFVSDGPQDARIISNGLPPVTKNAFGDFIQTPGSDSFDVVQAFTVVRMALTMAQRALSNMGIANPIPWQWNSADNSTPIKVCAHGLPGTMNAFYSRSDQALKFGHFIKLGSNPPERVYTCRSFDIVAHETGHAILDSLQPGWISTLNPPQTGALHESFGDLTAIFLALNQMDMTDTIIVQTKADLHDKTFLADIAEQMGLALGRTNGLRNADNNFKLSQLGTEVHALSQVFTGAVYDILADIFTHERNIVATDDAKTLYICAQYLYGLLLRAILAAPASRALFANVALQMLTICKADGKDQEYTDAIINNFTLREILIAPSNAGVGDPPLPEPPEPTAHISADVNAAQNRNSCCGTMKRDEYFDQQVEDEVQRWFLNGSYKGKKQHA